ncbi:Hvo_1808 family surface protein [Halocatena salina]|uniref:Hvo_1808 family surface protein n=1 Tax=Halocatena salina TaxID=2934340 RepID=A0A8U0A006_9EURY|nr:Hvo_1808 family surface protein [Halocatena salina]UPM42385.1 Hvo_1808 family surface protein [Halocatena salina]
MRFRPVMLLVMVVLAGCGSMPTLGTDSSPTETAPSAPNSQGTLTAPGGTDDPDIGRHNGYTHNQTLSIEATDGLNESEREAVVSRAMARVELVRGTDFKQDVSVDIRSRSEFKQGQETANVSESFQQFDNAKFEAMFLVGEGTNSLSTQSTSRGENVLGYYSNDEESIVIVSDSETPTLDGEKTLAHELTHALQDQHFNLSSYNKTTRDEYNAVNGLIEGEANLVQQRYMSLCSGEWNCLPNAESGGSTSPPDNWGVYLLDYFPYAEGLEFVTANQRQGGWDRVDELFSEPPETTEQVIHPETYDTDRPASVSLTDRNRNGWDRVHLDPEKRGATRPDHAVLGQSAMTVMFAQTAFDSYNRSEVVSRKAILNPSGDGSSNSLNYSLSATTGWNGDRLHVYEKNDKTGYVWKSNWDSSQNASEFADAYRALLSHWGGTKTGDGTWVIEDGPFADAFSLTVTDSTVVIVNAPTTEDLGDVRSEASNG